MANTNEENAEGIAVPPGMSQDGELSATQDSRNSLPQETQNGVLQIGQPVSFGSDGKISPTVVEGANEVLEKISVGCQTGEDPLAIQLTNRLQHLTARVKQLTELTEQLHTHRQLLSRVHVQLSQADAENGRLRRHMQLLGALFQDLVSEDSEGSTRSNITQPPESAPQPEAAEPTVTDAVRDRREVLRVSRTYLRLRDLILEKRSLLAEIEQLRSLNGQLSRRLSQQEERLSSVAAELHTTWGLVSRLRQQHANLHTAESMLRYELREKRRLLGRLRGELEYTRRRAELSREMSAESEVKWRELRRELDLRKRQSAPPGAATEANASAVLSDGSAEDTESPHGSSLVGSPEEIGSPSGENQVPRNDVGNVNRAAFRSRLTGIRLIRGVSEAGSFTSTDTDTAYASLDAQQVRLDVENAQPTHPIDSVDASQPDMASLISPDGGNSPVSSDGAGDAASTSPSDQLSPRADQLGVTNSFNERLATLLTDMSDQADALGAMDEAPAAMTASEVMSDPSEVIRVAVAALRATAASEPPLVALPERQRALTSSHADPTAALVASVVAVSEPSAPPAEYVTSTSPLPEESTELAGGEAGSGSDAEGPADVLQQARAAGLGSAAWVPDDQISRSTAELLAEVAVFLERPRASSDGVADVETPSPRTVGPSFPDSTMVTSTDSTSSEEEVEGDDPSGDNQETLSSVGCRLLSLLPGRMVHLRHERQRLAEHAGQLQHHVQTLQRSVSRLRAQRRERRRQARDQAADRQRLLDRVQQLEAALNVQSASTELTTAARHGQLPPTEMPEIISSADAASTDFTIGISSEVDTAVQSSLDQDVETNTADSYGNTGVTTINPSDSNAELYSVEHGAATTPIHQNAGESPTDFRREAAPDVGTSETSTGDR